MGLALVALCAGGCSDEDDGDTAPLTTNGGSGGSGDTSATAGSSGSAGDGTANGGSGGSGGTADAGTTDGGEDEPEPASGETGLFVGATAAHNAIREQASAEGIEPSLPDLTWSDELAVVAQDWADTLTREECGSIAHRPNGRLGENIAARSSRGISLEPMPPEEAVQGWADEVECWTYGRITGGNPNVQGGEQCEPQCIASKNSTGCGHYTQLVWANTRRVGCGYSTCTTDSDSLVEVWVCNYDPPGNVIGQFPYQTGN